MIIDCHGHYTTAPAAHQKFRDAQIAALKDPTAPAAEPGAISDDEIRETIEKNQLRLQQRARLGPDDLLPARLGHGTSRRRRGDLGRLDARLQRSDPARGRPVPGELRRRLPAAAVPGRAHRPLGRRARALRARARLHRLQPEPGSVRRALDLAAAHRPALVPVLREDGRARRAGDGARVRLLQPELPRDRRPLHQRRHHRVHAVHRGRPVPRFPDAALHHSARRRRGALSLGPLPRARGHAQAAAAGGARDEATCSSTPASITSRASTCWCA